MAQVKIIHGDGQGRGAQLGDHLGEIPGDSSLARGRGTGQQHYPALGRTL